MTDIPLAAIDATGRLRAIDVAWVEVLAASFEERGQDTDVEVRPASAGDKGFKLTVGGHRFAAAVLAGWTTIRANVVPKDERAARLTEIDENLIRNELSVLDRALHLAERKRIWEELHPETAQGGDRKSLKKKTQNQVANLATRFSAATAERTGFSERTVQRACQLADALDHDTVALISGTPVADNQAQLSALAKLDGAERRRAAKLIKDGTSFTDALARLGLRDEVDPEEALFRTLVSGWDRAGAKVRRRFLAHINKKKAA